MTADAVQALSDQTVLKDEMAIEAAIRALERHLVDPATRLNETIAQLAELENSPHALEFALASKWCLSFVLCCFKADPG